MPSRLSPRLPKRAPYLAYRAGAEIARLIPEPLGAPLAKGVAQAAPFVLAERRRQVERNLRRVYGAGFGGEALQHAVTATFESYGRYFYELFRLPSATPDWIEAHFACDGIEHIEAAVAAGHGAVLALPHLGNWDHAGAWLALQGFRVTVVAEPVEPPELFQWFVETRRRLGMRVVALSPTAGTEVLAAAGNNEVVCLLCDRDLTGDGIEVEFFGERTTLPGGPALVALRGGVPLIPVGCYFRPHGRHQAQILPPVPSAREGRLRDDLARITQSVAHRFEDLIRVAPTDWHLLQPNWPSDHAAVANPPGRGGGFRVPMG